MVLYTRIWGGLLSDHTAQLTLTGKEKEKCAAKERKGGGIVFLGQSTSDLIVPVEQNVELTLGDEGSVCAFVLYSQQ